jgi:hypothetical protein
MKYFIWDKESRILGIPAQIILETRPDFKNDIVIVISNDNNEIITVESKTCLKDMYEIHSDDIDIIAQAAMTKIAKDNPKTIVEALKEKDDVREDDTVRAYLDILEDFNKVEIDESEDKYEDPDVKIIDLSDVSEGIEVKKLRVNLSHVFIAEDKSKIANMQCMVNYKTEKEKLTMKLEKAKMEGDYHEVNLITREIELLDYDISDECDAKIKLDVERIFDYGDNIIMHCVNGLNVIIDTSIVNSLRENAIEYEKRKENNEKYRVHYKTVDIVLNAWYNELNERGNTVFITNID